jgi:cysteine sulfinate desulfinase/cysteine desulfurase-like protein
MAKAFRHHRKINGTDTIIYPETLAELVLTPVTDGVITLPEYLASIETGKIDFIAATCATAASTAAKVVTIAGYTLEAGTLIAVKYTNGNTASSPTINVNGGGAKAVRLSGGAPTATSGTGAAYCVTNGTVMYYYDGSYFNQLGSGDITDAAYSAMSVAEGTEGTATTARTVRADYLKQIIESHTLSRQIVTVPSSAWTQASPSTATVAVPGITGTMTALDFDVEGASADQAHIEASAGLGNTDVTPGNGTITLTAIGVVPTVDLSLIVTIY